MITIRNRQRKVLINISELKKNTQTILDALNYSDYDIGILITTNASMRTFNRDYRKKDKPTDVLSFPYHSELKANERIKPKTEEDKNLGDLIFSAEYIQKDAQNYNVTFEDRLKLLLVHGICHLLGYDHIKDEDYKIMHKKEKALLKKLG